MLAEIALMVQQSILGEYCKYRIQLETKIFMKQFQGRKRKHQPQRPLLDDNAEKLHLFALPHLRKIDEQR